MGESFSVSAILEGVEKEVVVVVGQRSMGVLKSLTNSEIRQCDLPRVLLYGTSPAPVRQHFCLWAAATKCKPYLMALAQLFEYGWML